MQFINYCAALPVATTPFEGEFKVRERALRPDPGQCALDPRLNAKVLRLIASLSTSRRFQLLVLWPSELLRAPPNDTARVVSSRRISSRLVSSRLVSSRLVSSRLVSSPLVSSRLVSSRLVSSRRVSLRCSACLGHAQTTQTAIDRSVRVRPRGFDYRLPFTVD